MKVKTAIILAAGHGTRMGEIGKSLAKPLWPFFGITLLELQISFLKKNFGISKFFINSHHLHEQFESIEIENFEVVYEPTLLDQGGGILNIVKRYNLWDEPLLINNADQLFFIREEEYSEALRSLESFDVVLLGLKVKKEDGYNKLKTKEGNTLIGIEKNNLVAEDTFQTYSGLSLLKCKPQNYEGEILSFFNAVSNYEKLDVKVVDTETMDYFDFGKLSTYYSLCFSTKQKIDEGQETPLIDLLRSSRGYELSCGEGLNFSDDKQRKAKKGEIVLNEGVIDKSSF